LNFNQKIVQVFLKHFNSADFSHENRSIQICCGIFTPPSGTTIIATPDKAHPLGWGDRHCPLLHRTSILKFILNGKGITMKNPQLFIVFA